jgi:hypothetical protein
MRLAEKTETSQTGNISAPVDTLVRLEATADRPLASARIAIRYLAAAEPGQADSEEISLNLPSPQVAKGEFRVKRSGEYRIHVTDEAKIPNQPLARQIVALPDLPPVVSIVEPGKDIVVAPEASVAILAEAKDDFSLQGLTLFVQTRAGEEWKPFRSWTYSPPLQDVREGLVLDLKGLKLAIGSTLSYYVQASDGHPGREESAGKSRIYQIAVADKSVVENEQKRRQEELRNVIRKLIAMQKANLGPTEQMTGWSGAEISTDKQARDRFQSQAGSLFKAEEDIYTTASEAARTNLDAAVTDMAEGLASIAAQEITQAVAQLSGLRSVPENAHVRPAAETAAATEREVVTLLEKLLADPRALLAERSQKKTPEGRLSEKPEEMMSARERAEKMLSAIKGFEQEQREVVQLSKKLGEIPVDDFTKDDEKTLSDLLETELKWAKYFQEAATDLSKLPPQDFSLATMAKEYLEVYSEVQKAADAAQKKAMEIATPLEQGGLELAKSIETNIEKWLSQSPDREAWKMEDPVQDYDVPISELPDELEDLIGDLMEEEEELLDEAADATSGWLDNIDLGVGWDTMDGPISNMSAKGVTGNRLPDSHEIAGRSGEGRTGKSTGQFVEESAAGKGGRQTPSRLTPDPFEAGAVKDTSPEQGTASTGGGKLSGAGQEGFQGPTPPALKDALKRMASRQQQLIDKAQRLDHGLQKYRYPRAQLPSTIELMEEIKKDLDTGRYISTAGAGEKVVLSNLRELKDLVDKQKQVQRDLTALMPKEIRQEIAAGLHEGVPKTYREMVNEYFRALSEAGSSK